MTVGIGLLIGWVYQVSVSVSEQQIAHQRSGRPATVAPTPGMVFVGQITGIFDAQWSDPSTAAIDYAYVPLGRRYALASGLMEISYASGARVILQGPCVYEVVSKTGGYLAIGKVTARVEREERGEGRGKKDGGEKPGKSPVSNKQSSSSFPLPAPSPSPLSPLPSSPFALRPPSSPIWGPSSASRSTNPGAARPTFSGARSRCVSPTEMPRRFLWRRTNRPESIPARFGLRKSFVKRVQRLRLCARCPGRLRSSCTTRASV